MKDCCEVMKLVLDRGTLETRQVGITMGHFFSAKGNETGSRPIVYFKRAKRGKGEPKQPFDDSTYAPLKFCPFCAKAFRMTDRERIKARFAELNVTELALRARRCRTR